MAPSLTVVPHPELHLGAFAAQLPAPLGSFEESSPARQAILAFASLSAPAPLTRDEAVRADVRSLLRHGGYKPTGRGKPSSEYLVQAVEKERLGPINLVVDACNVVSLHAGLPISVVDLDRLSGPLTVSIAAPDERYVFNASGQVIDVAGLLCLHDAEGPCANAVKDSQRTKTSADTRRCLALIWGPRAHRQRVDAACGWYEDLLKSAGAEVEPVPRVSP
ncbi:MAG: phenylalanine--tRNA ligase beta subunit-related protein [Polyangiaceae bacterium]